MRVQIYITKKICRDSSHYKNNNVVATFFYEKCLISAARFGNLFSKTETAKFGVFMGYNPARHY